MKTFLKGFFKFCVFLFAGSGVLLWGVFLVDKAMWALAAPIALEEGVQLTAIFGNAAKEGKGWNFSTQTFQVNNRGEKKLRYTVVYRNEEGQSEAQLKVSVESGAILKVAPPLDKKDKFKGSILLTKEE